MRSWGWARGPAGHTPVTGHRDSTLRSPRPGRADVAEPEADVAACTFRSALIGTHMWKTVFCNGGMMVV
eukprot:3554027-Prymnesium_polylepis.1